MKKYINTMYRPAFLILCVGLSVFACLLLALAINLRIDMLSNQSGILFRYPDMLEKIIFPIYILLPVTFVIDLNERNKKSWRNRQLFLFKTTQAFALHIQRF